MWLSEEGIAIATSRTMRKLGIAEERNVTPINIDWNISSGEDGGEFTAWARDGAINFIAGKTYSVTTDSGSFTTVCKNHDGILYLGNLSFIIPGIPNAGESFVVMETADAGGVASGAYDFNKGTSLLQSNKKSRVQNKTIHLEIELNHLRVKGNLRSRQAPLWHIEHTP